MNEQLFMKQKHKYFVKILKLDNLSIQMKGQNFMIRYCVRLQVKHIQQQIKLIIKIFNQKNYFNQILYYLIPLLKIYLLVIKEQCFVKINISKIDCPNLKHNRIKTNNNFKRQFTNQQYSQQEDRYHYHDSNIPSYKRKVQKNQSYFIIMIENQDHQGFKGLPQTFNNNSQLYNSKIFNQ